MSFPAVDRLHHCASPISSALATVSLFSFVRLTTLRISWNEAAGPPGDVVAGSLHTEETRSVPHILEASHGEYRTRSASAREPALHPHRRGRDPRTADPHHPRAPHGGAGAARPGADPARGLDRERMGRAPPRGPGPHGDRGRPQLR